MSSSLASSTATVKVSRALIIGKKDLWGFDETRAFSAPVDSLADLDQLELAFFAGEDIAELLPTTKLKSIDLLSTKEIRLHDDGLTFHGQANGGANHGLIFPTLARRDEFVQALLSRPEKDFFSTSESMNLQEGMDSHPFLSYGALVAIGLGGWTLFSACSQKVDVGSSTAKVEAIGFILNLFGGHGFLSYFLGLFMIALGVFLGCSFFKAIGVRVFLKRRIKPGSKRK